MKKVILSLVAIVLAAAMVFSFAACSDKEEPETTAPEVTDAAEDVIVESDETTIADAEVATEETTVEETTVEETTVEETTAAPTAKADIIALYNEATKNAVDAKPGFKKTVTTELNDLKMGALAKIDLVRDTVGDFLGEGTETISAAKGKKSDALKASTLSESDVKDAKCELSSDGKYYEVTITVKNEKNPLKDKSSLNKFTNDYKDINEMRAGLEDAGAAVETIDITVKSATIKAKIAVDTKEFKSVDYVIDSDAYLTNVKYTIAKVKVVTGNIYTTVSYSDFSY